MTPAASGDAPAPGWDDAASARVRGAMVDGLAAGGFPADVVDLAESCDRCFELDAEYLNPLPAWRGEGGCVLLGDAAHAMPPFLGQGANQAVQDAYALATALADLERGAHEDLDAALGAYEAGRKVPVSILGFNSVVLGAVETLLPEVARDAFFLTTGTLGVARAVFLNGAIPKVL